MHSFSDAGQDTFALLINNNKQFGTFVDIGCAYPIDKNNTWLLENEYGWRGLLIDNNPQYTTAISQIRSSPFICDDATTLNYSYIFERYKLPNIIDFLSLDIDPPNNTLKALKALPLDIYKFRAICFEHDSYWFGDLVKIEAKEVLLSYGYTLFKEDVQCSKGPFEDWYVYLE